MADKKLKTGIEEEKIPEAPEPVVADPASAPNHAVEPAPTQEQVGTTQLEPGDVTI